MARVKFIRDKEPNIIALQTHKTALDGAIYIATDSGKMWVGDAAGSLLEIQGGSNITIDTSLSETSTNPVQNKVVTAALKDKASFVHTHTKDQITDLPHIPTATSELTNDAGFTKTKVILVRW